MIKKISSATLAVFAMLFPTIATAHEMYVLESSIVSELLTHPPTNPLDIISANIGQFIFWATAVFLLLILLLFFSLSHRMQDKFNPFLFKLKPYAFVIARGAVGVCLIFSGLYQTLFGPEMSLVTIFGTYTTLTSWLLIIIGITITLGIFVRTAAVIGLGIFAVAVGKYGIYLLTYVDYLGILLALLLVGAGKPAFQNIVLHDKNSDSKLQKFRRSLSLIFSDYALLIIRLGLGFSIMYAAFYGKFLHSNVALQVVLDYRLTDYFPFSPEFIVLGAGILEMLFGLFFVLGIHLRFSAIFFAIFLFLSYLYFPEAAWPHLILVGGALATFAHGYDNMTLEGRLFKRGKHEPIF
ncbi:MAG: DoxX family protein [Patescibacteria group bacterium]